jgi:FKBP-type peptidyl-prolyl cis-trans isomerase SlyD
MKCKAFAILVGAATFLCFSVVAAAAQDEAQKKDETVIKDGSKVSMEYTLYLEDGSVEETNVGKDPLEYEHGAKMMIPGLETKLEGLKAGDTIKVEVPPEEGYGVVNPDGFQEVPKEKIPPESRKVGTVLKTTLTDGRVARVRVHEVKEDTIVMDFNHPLAGKTLTFEVKILDVK